MLITFFLSQNNIKTLLLSFKTLCEFNYANLILSLLFFNHINYNLT